jgi:hypothetical protein
MSRHYYAVSGTMSNAITIRKFRSRAERDAWVYAEPMSGTAAHYEYDRMAVTARGAREQLAYNNRLARDYRRYGAPYVDCYGTTGRMVGGR